MKVNFLEEIILPFYKKEMDVDAFMIHLEGNKEVQLFFNESEFMLSELKESGLRDIIRTPTNWIKTIYKRNPEKNISAMSIWADVRRILSEDNYIKYLPIKDVQDIMLDIIIGTPDFYNADKQVCDFIRNNILDNVKEITTLKSMVLDAKKKIKKTFLCENRYPIWLQNCEWPFDARGKPLVFRTQINKSPGNRKYIFVNPKTNTEVVKEQFD
jgi:hypothetical protein